MTWLQHLAIAALGAAGGAALYWTIARAMWALDLRRVRTRLQGSGIDRAQLAKGAAIGGAAMLGPIVGFTSAAADLRAAGWPAIEATRAILTFAPLIAFMIWAARWRRRQRPSGPDARRGDGDQGAKADANKQL